MSSKTGIEWTDATWNPWQGCHKVSVGCENCYMYRDKKRYGQDPAVVVRSKPQTFNMPLKLSAGLKVFTCSWSDFFHKDADPWRPEAWEIIRSRQDLIFQILTKRPERIKECLPTDWDWASGYRNVWLGISAENQENFDERWPILRGFQSVIRFLSLEPLLGPINFILDKYLVFPDWVIVGGESGPWARPCDVGWVRSLVAQSKKASIPCFIKQLGSRPYTVYSTRPPDETPGWTDDLKHSKGGDPSEWPTDLRVREFPK